jgi:hypothetical protein
VPARTPPTLAIMTSPQAPETGVDNPTIDLDTLYEKILAIIATQQEHGTRLAEILETQEIREDEVSSYASDLAYIDRRFKRLEHNLRKLVKDETA